MIGLVQRVTEASVSVAGTRLAEIDHGLLVLVGVSHGDTIAEVERLADKLLRYRVFADAAGRMNLCVRDVGGSLLLVPQFTLAADTSGGLRPSFSSAAPPEQAAALFQALVDRVAASGVPYGCGQFGADMQVALINDGPVTFWLEVAPAA